MLVNIMMFVTMYPVVLIMYFLFSRQYQYANGCLFAVNMKPEWIKEPKVQAIVEKFQTEMKKYVIILMLVPFTSFFTKYMSIQLTIWVMWILLAIGLLCLPLIHANGALKKWKREQKLYDSAVMEHYVELKAVGKVRRVKFLTFFLPNLVGLFISLLPLLVKSVSPDFAKNLELGSVSWLCVLMWLCGLLLWACAIWMDKQPVTVISSDSDINLNYTRAKKNIWKKFWLAANWMNTLFLFTIPASALWIADMGMSVLIASVVYALLICGLAVLLMRQLKNVERAYENKQDLTASEEDDRHWIGGIFYYNPADRHSMVTKKVGIGTTMNLATPLGKGMTIFSVIVLIVTIPAMCIWLIMLDFTPIRLQVENQTLYAKHLNVDYEIDVTDIENLDKITELPSWSKSYGTAMDTLEKGTFFIRNVGKCEVFLNPENTEFLHFTADGTDYYMSGYDDAQTEEIYNMIIKNLRFSDFCLSIFCTCYNMYQVYKDRMRAKGYNSMINDTDHNTGNEKIKFYMAPMEGLTGYIYRNAYQKYFHDIDRYFTPFITNKKLDFKAMKEIDPEHNRGMDVVPQILTNQAEDFISITKQLKQYGYHEVNLNLGCPSGTVVAKNRGAGFLSVLDQLDFFLDEIFTKCDCRISIKTRVGKDSPDEWEKILAIYEKYPLSELIVHPRIQKDFYKYTPRMEQYQYAVKNSRHSLCYNGDIHSVEAYEKLLETFSSTEKVMLGRGILQNPGLVGELRACCSKTDSDILKQSDGSVQKKTQSDMRKKLDKETLRAFHDDICDGYKSVMSGDRNTLFKMKELWCYMSKSFTNPEKHLKKIKKTERLAEYYVIVDALFREQELKF